MLPADSRLTSPTSFRRTTRSGRRAAARTLVTHLAVPDQPAATAPQVGFIVSKAVGGAVVRNRVKRRLRHAVRERIAVLPAGSTLVVRAQAAAAGASYQELAADLDRCLDRSLQQVSGRVER